MLFYAELDKNPELLIDLVDESDVLNLANIINVQDDSYACSRIRYELALADTKPSHEPILIMSFDIFDEKMYLDLRHSSLLSDLKELKKTISKMQKLINKDTISSTLIHTGQISQNDLDELKKIIGNNFTRPLGALINTNKRRKKLHQDWGKLGLYKIYIKKVSKLYTELSGRKFTSDFMRSEHEDWAPISEGTRFAMAFHNILNRVGQAYGVASFTNKNLKSVCNEVRQKHNLLSKN